MANNRDLKKDVNFLTYEVISDCYVYMHLFPEKKTDEVKRIITDVVKMRNDLISRINHAKGENPKQIKGHYKSIHKDLIDNVDQAFQSLSSLTKK